MSVTFTVPNAPIQTTPCPYCASEGRCDPWCDGTVQESEAPEVNWSNANARAMLSLLSLEHENLCGSIEASVVPLVRQTIVGLLNSFSGRQEAVRVPYHEVGLQGASLYDQGLDDDGIFDRLINLDALCAYAIEHDEGITWG